MKLRFSSAYFAGVLITRPFILFASEGITQENQEFVYVGFDQAKHIPKEGSLGKLQIFWEDEAGYGPGATYTGIRFKGENSSGILEFCATLKSGPPAITV